MKTIKQYTYSIILLVLVGLLPAFTSLSAAEASFEKLYKTYTLNSDGSIEERVYKELKIFTHAAMNSKYGESFIVYNPEFQELKINASYTIQKDGTKVITPENAFVEVLPASATNAPAYNNLKEMVVVHTGLELGATIVLDYSIVSKSGKALDIFSMVKELSPIKDYNLTINVPENETLNYDLLNSSVRPSVKVKDGVKTVTYRLRNVEARPYQYPVYNSEIGLIQQVASGMMPVVVANTYANYQEAVSVLKSQMIVGDRKVIDNKILELKKEVGDDKQNLREAISKFMSYLYSSKGLCKVSLQEAGYKLRPASEVLKSMYGTRAELANLDAALQNAAGLNTDVKVCAVKAENVNNIGLSGVVTVVCGQPDCGVTDYMTITTLDGKDCHSSVTSSVVSPETDTETLEYKEGNYDKVSGGLMIMTLPGQNKAAGLYSYSANTSIKENILLPNKVNSIQITKVKLPEGKKWMKKTDVSVSNSIGEVVFDYELSGDEIVVTRKIKVDKQLITTSDYKEFYSLMKEWKDKNNHIIVVR